MMDIVDRLRMYRVDLSVRIFAEAADEIEKLRAENEQLFKLLVVAVNALCEFEGGTCEMTRTRFSPFNGRVHVDDIVRWISEKIGWDPIDNEESK